MTVDIDLTESIAIVTGAGRGIGEGIAVRLAEAGADVVAAARTPDELQNTVTQIERRGVEGLALPTDIRNAGDIDDLLDTTVETFGSPNILVNNAGVAHVKSTIADYTNEDINDMIEVNFKAVFNLSRQFGLLYRESDINRDGRIINISSILGQLGIPSRTMYGGTKAAVAGLTRGLAADFARDGITVNCISPGLVRVSRIEEAINERSDEFEINSIPLGRMGTPEEVAHLCLFLASKEANYITGVNIPVDGGVSLTASLYQ